MATVGYTSEFMATVGRLNGISCESYGNASSPTLEGSFGVDIGDETGWKQTGPSNGMTVTLWKNPHLGSAITPYIPTENDVAFITECQEVFDKKLQPGAITPLSAEETFFLNQICTNVVPVLHPTTLAYFSMANKCSYAAVKQFLKTNGDAYYSGALKRNHPNLQFIDSKLCAFSSEDQFKIFIKRVMDEKKPYAAKFMHNAEKCKIITDELKRTAAELALLKGQADANEPYALIRQVLRPNCLPSDKQTFLSALEIETGAVRLFETKMLETMVLRIKLAGWSYNGPDTPIDPDSIQGKLLDAINVRLPESFNNQERFEKVIRSSEALKNTTSS